MARDVQSLERYLGADADQWPKGHLIDLPVEVNLGEVAHAISVAVQTADTSQQKAAALIRHVNDVPLKRWFIDVAQHAGKWRVTHNRHKEIVARVKNAPRAAPTRRVLRELFRADNYHCRYCQSPVIGDREQFKQLARIVGVPELLTTGSNEKRHGIYLMLRASHDHVVPLNAGGRDDRENLVTACWPCQFGKYHYTLGELGMGTEVREAVKDNGSWLRVIDTLNSRAHGD